jgi:hypothetical protein
VGGWLSSGAGVEVGATRTGSSPGGCVGEPAGGGVPGDVSVGGGKKPDRVGDGLGSRVGSGVGDSGVGNRVGGGVVVAMPVGDPVIGTVGVGNAELNGFGDWKVVVAVALPEMNQVSATASSTRKPISFATGRCVRTIWTRLKTDRNK